MSDLLDLRPQIISYPPPKEGKRKLPKDQTDPGEVYV